MNVLSETLIDRGSTPTTSVVSRGTDLVMERIFEAPRDLLWRALTEPDRVARWWGPHRYTTTVESLDPRPGGTWRFTNHGADGQEFAFTGTYLEVVPFERLAYTFIVDMDGMRDQVGHVVDELEDLGDRTRLVETMHFGTVEEMDQQLGSGMLEGALETWDRLAVELARG